MPTPPYAQLRASINGGGPVTGAITTAVAGDTIALSMASTVGVVSQRWDIYGFPPTFPCPAGWTDGGDTYYSTVTTPDTFTIGADWGKYMLRLTINGGKRQIPSGTTTIEVPEPTFVDEATAIDVVSVGGLHDLGRRETNQFGVDWTDHQRANLRALDGATGIAGPSGTNTVPNYDGATVTWTDSPVVTGVGLSDSGTLRGELSATASGVELYCAAGKYLVDLGIDGSHSVLQLRHVVVAGNTLYGAAIQQTATAAVLAFDAGASVAAIAPEDRASDGPGCALVITAGKGKNGHGGDLQLSPGAPQGTDKHAGSVKVALVGKSGTASESMFQVRKSDDTNLFSVTNDGKIGLFGADEVAQASRVGQLTDSSTGSATSTIGDVGALFSQSVLNDIHASFAAKINGLETIVHNIGMSA